jgi:hypothetical protein
MFVNRAVKQLMGEFLSRDNFFWLEGIVSAKMRQEIKFVVGAKRPKGLTTSLVVRQDSFEGPVRIILDFGFWILENCPIPHFKIDRPLDCSAPN